jgi:membrane protease YdiL (CAAX protease family)
VVARVDVPAGRPSSADEVSTNTEGILVFLAISFGVAWAGMLGATLGLGLSMVDPRVQLAGAFTPAIAAIVVRRWVTREGFADAGLRLRLRGNVRWYLIGWLGPLALVAVALAIAAVSGLWRVDLGTLDHVVPGVPAWLLVALLCWSCRCSRRSSGARTSAGTATCGRGCGPTGRHCRWRRPA